MYPLLNIFQTDLILTDVTFFTKYNKLLTCNVHALGTDYL
jgi:hypothetical protein